MGKKPAAGGGKSRAKTAAPDRASRVAHGRAVLQNVQARIEELEMRSSPGLLGGGKRVAGKTRKKYEDEEVTDYAYQNSIDDKELRVWVDLAKLANRVDDIEDADLKEAFNAGRLMLTRSDLPELLDLDDPDDLEKRFRSRLKEQL